jgi:translation initiation factor 3 subunit B
MAGETLFEEIQVPDEVLNISDSEIDFSDIEKKFSIKQEDIMEKMVVIDNLPIVDEKKESKLITVLKKILKNIQEEISEDKIMIPKDESSGNSLG